MLSTKDLLFKERPAKKLVDWYVGPYIIDQVVSMNIVKLRLPTSMRIHLVVNVSWVVQYKKQVEERKVEEVKLVKVEEVKEWKVEKILNKRKVREVVKYLVWWKGFTIKHNSWEREEDLENTKKVVTKFKEKVNTEVRRQKKLDMAEKRDFRRGKLPGKYIAKILYSWDNGNFENKYLRKLKRNWEKWKEKIR